MSPKIAICALSLVVTACAAGPAPRTGFLSDYSGLEPVGSSDSLLEQRPPADFDPRRFNAVMIEPTEVRVEDLSEEDKTKLSDVFREALIERLGGALPIVEQSGPGVFRVRTAIVDARKANVAINAVTSLLVGPVSNGGVAAEAEVLDGGTGARIAALSWSRRGGKITEVGLSYTQLGQARSGLRSFAKRLADLFSPPAAPTEQTDRRR
ncbi:DUF3313 domain-containing protein [Blastomonas sp. UPD001]|uniref:DUF3313 domain-containing protein n=1 Tax=Blastomonas sp. UPD001 TaxID=2217673 RepID=UPI001300770E|nr:DUF3313 domain-containing protein [Blastomonas sp. UPD001]